MKEKREKLILTNELLASRLPVFIWISTVYAATIILQFFKEPLILESSVFTGLFTVHALLHWNSYRMTNKHFWFYFSAQGILIYLCAILMPDGYQAVLIGLLPILIAQSLGFSYQLKRVGFVVLISIVLFFDSALTLSNTHDLILFLPIFVLMLIIVLAYALLFYQQVHERLRTQSFLFDLKEAHTKVEELTLSNERQRMARDLHDTLAQGVAGLIMRLEAADAYMVQGNTDRTHEIIKQSMVQARRTLAEARLAIDNLRAKSASEIDLKEAIHNEVQHFKDATGIMVFTHFKLNKHLSRTLMEHTQHIVKECLTNIAKHARADQVWVNLSDQHGQLLMEIRDNGIGFNPETIGTEVGHYGLLGIQERVRLIGGKMEIHSNSEGTSLQIETTFLEGDAR
ncbi:sensor histidine kinase [Paenibacillus sp. BIHB 4019]|uniref:sensor histidine kinase n=1 Tax=Paenibacillus sp. BIHB 4019 TaxID=1870819 RepID=UPI001558E6FE|nr:sensor histidine kinase [Paenibacillus sp. BIHB 4019]